MTQDHEDIAESQWREGFRQRLIEARGKRTQQDMADLLGISQSAYSKYEGKRMSVMSVRLLPQFCKICAVSLEWLINGPTELKAAGTERREVKKPAKRSRASKAA